MTRKSKKKQQEQHNAMTRSRIESIINSLSVMAILALNHEDIDLTDKDRLNAIGYEIDVLSEKLHLSDEMIKEYLSKTDYVGSPLTIELTSAIQSLGGSDD